MLRPFEGPRAPEVPERLDSSGACLVMRHASFFMRERQNLILIYLDYVNVIEPSRCLSIYGALATFEQNYDITHISVHGSVEELLGLLRL